MGIQVGLGLELKLQRLARSHGFCCNSGIILLRSVFFRDSQEGSEASGNLFQQPANFTNILMIPSNQLEIST